MSHTKTKVVVIGSGPAGYTAAIYLARANMTPIMLTGMEMGGQLTTTTDVENYPGFAEAIQGPWLMEQMRAQAENVGTDIRYEMVTKVSFKEGAHHLESDAGNTYETEAVVIATGAQAKWLGLESEQAFRGFGVSGCATCDGFFFKNVPVAVIGGGNTAVEEALYLTKFASEVNLVHRRDSLRAEKVLQQRLFENPKIRIHWNYELAEVFGDTAPMRVKGIRLQSTSNSLDQKELSVEGVFIAIGHQPATEVFKGQVDMDTGGYIKVLPGSTKTNVPGVYAAGDVHDTIYRQAVTAAGFGCMAALDVIKYLDER